MRYGRVELDVWIQLLEHVANEERSDIDALADAMGVEYDTLEAATDELFELAAS